MAAAIVLECTSSSHCAQHCVAGFGPSQAAGSPLPLPAPGSSTHETPARGSDPQQAVPQLPALQRGSERSQETPQTAKQQGPAQTPTLHHSRDLQDTPQTQIVMQRRAAGTPVLHSGGRSEEDTPQTCIAVQRRVARPAAALRLGDDGERLRLLCCSCLSCNSALFGVPHALSWSRVSTHTDADCNGAL